MTVSLKSIHEEQSSISVPSDSPHEELRARSCELKCPWIFDLCNLAGKLSLRSPANEVWDASWA